MKGAFLEKDWLAEERAWAVRALLKPAQERWRGQPWAEKAVAIVGAALDLRAQTSLFEAKLGPLVDDFRQILKSAPDDPLLLLLGAQAFHAENLDWRASRQMLERLLSQPDLSTALRALALRDQIPQLMTQGAEYRYVRGELVDLMIRAVDDGSYLPEEAAVFVRHQMIVLDLVEVTMPSYLTRWQEAIAASQWAPWVKETLLGFGDIELAWLERSDDWAYKVKDEQWEGFSGHLKSARVHLQKAWESRPDRPEAATMMITVVMGESDDVADLRVWFDRAVSAQFDYRQAYNGLIWALRPRWHGGHEEMLAFGRACAATARYDTGVPTQMFCAALDVADEEELPFDVFRSEAVRPYLLPVIQGYLDEKGLPSQLRQLRVSNAAMAAWLVGDPALAARALEEVGPRLHHCTLEFMNELRLPEARLRGEVAAGAGLYGEGVSELSSLPRSVLPETREALLTRLSADQTLSKPARAFVQEAQQREHFLAELAGGDWVSITPSQHLTSFIQTGGRWSADGDAFVASGDDTRWASLIFHLPFSDDLELRSEVSFENPQKVELSPKGCGFGHLLRWLPSTFDEAERGVRFMAMQDHSGWAHAQAYRTKPEQGSADETITLQPVNSWTARIASGNIAWAMNEAVVIENHSLHDLGIENESGMFGFVVQRLPIGTKVRFRNVQLRKLTPSQALTPIIPPADSKILDASTEEPPAQTTPKSAPKVPAPSSSAVQPTRPSDNKSAPTGPSNLSAIIFGASLILALLVHFLLKRRE